MFAYFVKRLALLVPVFLAMSAIVCASPSASPQGGIVTTLTSSGTRASDTAFARSGEVLTPGMAIVDGATSICVQPRAAR